MPDRRFWFHPWQGETLSWHRGYRELVHTADEPFGHVLHEVSGRYLRGPVERGDAVFIGANVNGGLIVAGAMIVGACTTRANAERLLEEWYGPEEERSDLWEAGFHVIAEPGSASTFDADRPPLDASVASQLRLRRFDANSLTHWRGLAIRDGRVDKQTIRALCELDSASGKLLCEAIGWFPPPPAAGG